VSAPMNRRQFRRTNSKVHQPFKVFCGASRFAHAAKQCRKAVSAQQLQQQQTIDTSFDVKSK